MTSETLVGKVRASGIGESTLGVVGVGVKGVVGVGDMGIPISQNLAAVVGPNCPERVAQESAAVHGPVSGLVNPAPAAFVCAWCDGEKGIKRGPGVSHGICAFHLKVQRAQARGMDWRRA